jgi:RimJ/RimL family protein N-acetyltransferase
MESKNLNIRPTRFQDCIEFAQWETQPSVTEFFSIDEDRNYEEILREYILWEEDPSKLQFTILLKNYEGEDQIIGRIIISRIDRHNDSLDITRIYIGPEELRNHGYGEEAMRLILEHCFIQLHTERVTLDHFTGNDPASRLYMKLGFVYEGVARNGAKKNGRFYDLNIMSLLRSEYYEKVHNK